MAKRVIKRKLKVKRIILLLSIIILSFTLFFNYRNIKIYYFSKITNYNTDTIATFLEHDLIDNVKDKEYSKTLEEIIHTKYYNQDFFDQYINIKYLNDDSFLSNISSLLNLGYSDNDINQINNKLTNESIQIIIANEYIKDIINIINLSYFQEAKLSRYLDYYQQEAETIENIITYVNIGLDNKYYTNVTKIENEDDLLVLVNKYNSLSSNYVPKDLTTINAKYQWLGRSNQLTKEAAKAFEKMCVAALKDNITILAGSGYRSYNYQKTLYNNYVARDGFAEAETFSARPGYSEHQTGLAMDITNKYGFIDKNDKEYTWLVKNSYKYGFILRYPENKDEITGYMYEEWHYRYVGIETAKEVYDSNLTYDEYVARKIS